MKKCSKCKETKEKDLFPKNKQSKGGYRNECKKCYSQRYEHECSLCLKKYRSSNSTQKYCSRSCAGKMYSANAKKGVRTNQYGDYEEREDKFKKRFESYHPNHIYISGYTKVEGTFKSKCLICGEYQTRDAQCAKPSRRHQTLSCGGCVEIAREKWRRERLVQEEIWWIEKLVRNQKAREEEAERQRILGSAVCTRCGKNYKAGQVNSIHCNECLVEIAEEEEHLRKQWEGKIINCHECGKLFEMRTSRSKHCSKGCMHRASYRINELRRRKRLRKNGRIDKSVTLTRLEQIYNNTCAICGGKVDKEDHRYDEHGNFIVGKKYPSTDHIIPISKGGTHNWNNVQLAHHYCNTVKNNIISEEHKNDVSNKQLTLI